MPDLAIAQIVLWGGGVTLAILVSYFVARTVWRSK